jgi:hypothetical protein
MRRKLFIPTVTAALVVVSSPHTRKSVFSSEFALLPLEATDVGVDHLPEPYGVQLTLSPGCTASATGNNSTVSVYSF